MAATKVRKKTIPARHLIEQVTAGGSPLTVDREKGIIYGVKILGRFSQNAHAHIHAGATSSEYSTACMDDAVRRQLYEGMKVRTNHPPKVNGRRDPKAERDVHDSLGVLRDVRRETGTDGEPGLYADLHYLKTHPLAESVCEDVERGLGVYGLSHNADAGKDRFDPATKRLVIESLADVRSVDLVDKPATNKNLWESEDVPQTTRRELLESLKPTVTAKRLPWLTWLLEDDYLAANAPPMEDAPAEDAEPEDKLWAGICDAISGILDKKKAGELDAAGAAKAIAKYLKAHDKLTGSEEPDDEPVEESDDEDEDDDKPKKKPVDESVELVQLRAEKAARTLCESLDFHPTAVQLEAVAAMPEAKRKPLIESMKGSTAKPGGTNKPKSGFAPKQPAKQPDSTKRDPKEDRAALMG